MNRRILLGCYELPAYGGASTSGYRLFKSLQERSIDAAYVNLVTPEDAEYFRCFLGPGAENPDGLKNVHTVVLEPHQRWEPPRQLTELIEVIRPDLLVGKGYIATLLMKKASRIHPTVFLSSGCWQAKELIARSKFSDFLSLKSYIERRPGRPLRAYGPEREAAQLADLIVTHSESVQFLYEHFYPSEAGKIYPRIVEMATLRFAEADQYAALKRPFSSRDIDLLFVASSWNRPEKNLPLVKSLAARSPGWDVHVVGETSGSIANACCHGLIGKREELFTLMGKAKTCVCPSLFDASPGVLFEASGMGCNLVASRNCGNWEICHPDLLVDPHTEDQFLQRIRLSRRRVFPDRQQEFRRRDGWNELLEVLSVL